MKRSPRRPGTMAAQILEEKEASVLDLLDHVLNKGVMASGDLMLGVAGIDLIYVRLSALLCAADRVLPNTRKKPPRRRPRPLLAPR